MMTRLICMAFFVLSAVGSFASAVASDALAIDLKQLAQHTNTGEVRDIAVANSRVWAATGGGLAVYSRKSGRFLFKCTSADGLVGNSLRVVKQLDGGRLFVGGDFGAVIISDIDKGRCDRKPRLTMSKIDRLSSAAKYSPINALVSIKDGHLVARLQGGLVQLSPDGKHLSPDRDVQAEYLSAAAMNDSMIALGDLSGKITLVSTLEQKRSELFLDGPILKLTAWKKGFVAATGEGLVHIEERRTRALSVANDCGKSVPVAATALALSPKQEMIVGTTNGNIYQLDDQKMSLLLSAKGGRISALAADRKKIWAGIGKQGLHMIHRNQPGKVRSLRPRGEICSNHVTHLARHRKWLVAATFDQGACVLTKRGWIPLPDLPSWMVHGVASDGRDLYLATSNGIARYGSRLQPRPFGKKDAPILRWLATSAATGAAQIGPRAVALTSAYGVVRVWPLKWGRTMVRYASHADGVPYKLTSVAAVKDKIFVASESEGVKRLGVGKTEEWHLQDHRQLPENWVTAISPVSADKIWVATCQQGAVLVDGQRTYNFDQKNGLLGNMLTSVVAYREGAFLGTLKGLSWVSTTEGVQNYDLDDNIPDPRSAGLYLEKNNLWYATEAGLVHYQIRS
jgi:ligand-binding sensor domain-containing protein